MYARAVSLNVLGKLFLRKTWTRVSRGDVTETNADCPRKFVIRLADTTRQPYCKEFSKAW